MIKPIGLEEIQTVPPVPGAVAARTVAQLTDAQKRRLVWFLQWRSHQDGGLKKLAHELLWTGLKSLGSVTMHRIGFGPDTYFQGAEFEKICAELEFHPLGSLEDLTARYHAAAQNSVAGCLLDLIEPKTEADRIAAKRHAAEILRRQNELADAIKPDRRRLSAVTFLYECRERALGLPHRLALLCVDPSASWETVYFRGLTSVLQGALDAQASKSEHVAASTKLAGIVQDALGFAHRTKSLVVIKGTERLGKTEAARKWVCANPDKARLVSLTAGTTDSLFYGEIFDALGCGDKKSGTSSELRGAIKSTLQNGDIALVFDEAHCLFGLSEKASIKRLEYIRTEFVNRGIPVVLVITPQFAQRLSELERKTSFNVNQFRGRVARWVELPPKPSRDDIECLCKFCLPDVPESLYRLLTNFALESEYPFAAVKHAITEARELLSRDVGATLDEEFIKRAIGFALFTSNQVAATLPAPASKPRRGRIAPAAASVPVLHAEPVHEAGNTLARRAQEPVTAMIRPDFSNSTAAPSRPEPPRAAPSRTEPALSR